MSTPVLSKEARLEVDNVVRLIMIDVRITDIFPNMLPHHARAIEQVLHTYITPLGSNIDAVKRHEDSITYLNGKVAGLESALSATVRTVIDSGV